MTPTKNSRIRFCIGDKTRFLALCSAYERIRECKATDAWPDTKEPWLPYFDAEALGHFWWPSPQEIDDFKKLYFSIPVPQRHTDPRLEHPWNFLSMFEAFQNGDYDLKPIEEISAEEAVLPFYTHGWPYGGTACMTTFIEAFGHKVLEVVA